MSRDMGKRIELYAQLTHAAAHMKHQADVLADMGYRVAIVDHGVLLSHHITSHHITSHNCVSPRSDCGCAGPAEAATRLLRGMSPIRAAVHPCITLHTEPLPYAVARTAVSRVPACLALCPVRVHRRLHTDARGRCHSRL